MCIHCYKVFIVGNDDVTLSADSEPPVISDCPETVTVYTDANSDEVSVTWDLPTVSDNHDDDVILNQTAGPTPGSFFSLTPQSIHTVTYEASDDAGNEAIPCSFQVIVQREF